MPLVPTGRKRKAIDSNGGEHWLVELHLTSQEFGFHPYFQLEDGRLLNYSDLDGTARLVPDEGIVFTLVDPPKVYD